MKLRSMMGGLAALGLIASAGAASAETWNARSFNDMVNDSRACIKGTVIEVSYITIDGATYTDARFEIEGRAFGPARQGTLRVRTEGGLVEGSTIPVVEVGSSGIRFFEGQEAIMFLERVGRTKTYIPLNGGQGIFNVRDGMVQLPIANEAVEATEALSMINGLRRQRQKNVAQ